jgi:hypothetical protein
LVAFVLFITFALVAVVVVIVRVASPGPPSAREPTRTLESPYRGPTEVRGLDGPTEVRVLDVSGPALWTQGAKGLLLGLSVSPLVGFPIALFLFQQPTLLMVALSTWTLGPYGYVVVAAQRGSRSAARAIGIAIGHSIALALLWIGLTKVFRGFSIGMG